jgi:hypothetical protein
MTYAALHREARNLGGHVGDGSAAVAEAANAISRLRKLPTDLQPGQRALRDTRTLFHRIDERIADLFEHGAHQRPYFVRTKVPRVVNDDGQITHRVRERFMPIASPVQTDLVRLVRDQLRPPPATACPSPGARDSRIELTQAITHRPPSRSSQFGL